MVRNRARTRSAPPHAPGVARRSGASFIARGATPAEAASIAQCAVASFSLPSFFRLDRFTRPARAETIFPPACFVSPHTRGTSCVQKSGNRFSSRRRGGISFPATDASTLSIGILTIDHPSRHAFDDRLRRAGDGYGRLRIDDVLRYAGYRPTRFESLPDLQAACDARLFDLPVVQCETPCQRTVEAIRTLRARFAESMPRLVASQRDAGHAHTLAFDAGTNAYLPYISPADTILSSVSTWLRWSRYRATSRRRWRVGPFTLDAVDRAILVDDCEHVPAGKHFQILATLVMNPGRPLSRRSPPTPARPRTHRPRTTRATAVTSR